MSLIITRQHLPNQNSNREIITDKNIIPQQFNDFFINIGHNIAKTIPNIKADPNNYLGQALKETLFLDPVNLDETRSLLISF